jgi:hypothetical protein
MIEATLAELAAPPRRQALADEMRGGVHDQQRRRVRLAPDADPEPPAVGDPRSAQKIEDRLIALNGEWSSGR